MPGPMEANELGTYVVEFLGAGYTQFHHRAPMRDLTETTRLTADQLHLICANCHAMLHNGPSPLTLDELKTAVRDVQRSSVHALQSRLTEPSV